MIAARRYGVAWLAVLTLLLISRGSYPISHPTLWAEDGAVWFYDAYTYGWASLLQPHTGYLQTLPRLVALLGTWLPMVRLPGWFVLAALIVQMAPVALLLARGAAIVPSAWARAALILFYVGMPNSAELYLKLTDAQWHLALVSFLLVVLPVPVPVPRRTIWRFVQYAALLLGGLSGPFSLFLAPLAWWQAASTPKPERRGSIVQAILLSVTAIIQLLYLLFNHANNADRDTTPLGASFSGLGRILTNQVFAGGVLGVRGVTHLGIAGWPAALTGAFAVLGVAVLGLAWLRGSSSFRKFLALGVMLFAAGMASPVVSEGTPQWIAMIGPSVGCRYYFFLILGWFAAFVVLAGDRNRKIRTAALLALACFTLGVAADWRYTLERGDTHSTFKQAALAFQRAAPGTQVLFPESPRGWLFGLIKH